LHSVIVIDEKARACASSFQLSYSICLTLFFLSTGNEEIENQLQQDKVMVKNKATQGQQMNWNILPPFHA
jgi:hypothetical protein